MNPNIIFGPVNSRRFGKSLGIDLSPFEKVCNYDCLYCELKGAKPVDFMQRVLDVKDILIALEDALKKHDDIDVITITANGEPTLYPHLKELVQEINKIKDSHKLLILSNSANLIKDSVKEALLDIDIVKLSLDCATKRCFKRIDRPHKDIKLQNIIDSIKEFKNLYKGSLIIEILVVEGINDKEDEFIELAKVLKDIKPDRVDIGSIDRPPAYDVRGVDLDRLMELGKYFEGLHVSFPFRKDGLKGKRLELNEDEIINLLSKRPQSFDEIKSSFTKKSLDIVKNLQTRGKIRVKNVSGILFYSL